MLDKHMIKFLIALISTITLTTSLSAETKLDEFIFSLSLIDNYKTFSNYDARGKTKWVVLDSTLFNISEMPIKMTLQSGTSYTKFKTDFGDYIETGSSYVCGLAMGVTNNLNVTIDYSLQDIDESMVSGARQNIYNSIQTLGLGVIYRF